MLTVCSFITPSNVQRNQIVERCNDLDLKMVYVNATLEECIKRDAKGYYKQALEGKFKLFTGIDSLFEEPNDSLEFSSVSNTNHNIKESVDQLIKIIEG